MQRLKLRKRQRLKQMTKFERDEPIAEHIADPPGTGNWTNDDAAVVAAIAAINVILENAGLMKTS